MTDYGRSSGSEPWHAEDPLFGDVYDQGQGYQQQPQAQQQDGWQAPYATGRQPHYPEHQQPHYPEQGYPQNEQQYPQQQPYPGQQQYPPQYGQHPQDPEQHSQQQPYPQAQYDGWDTGSHPTGGYGPQDPYGGQQPQDPYATGGGPDFYGQNGYPPPQQPQFRQAPQQDRQPQQGMGPGPGQDMGQGRDQPQQGQGMAPGHDQQQAMGQGHGQGQAGPQEGRPQEPGVSPLRTAPAETGSWDAGDDEGPREQAFFAGSDDEDDDAPAPSSAGGRRAGKSQPKGGRKRRSGCACMVVLVVLAGGLGGAGYFGYHFYESHFGPSPDYTGEGIGDVQVEIPKGSTLTDMGNLLKNAGVVKSVGAFTGAARNNPKGQFIQAGVYVMHKNMSAASAVAMMLDPKSQNAMIVSEGMRDAQIYAVIDTRLGLPAGSAKKAALAKYKSLGLPSWANSAPNIRDPLEGFLFPSRYSVAKGMKPEVLLREMVGEANKQFAQYDMAAEARKQGLTSPLQLLTVASLVQAEGKTTDDFRKMAKVVYNRLVPSNKETYGILQFDSTYNYIKNQSATRLNLTQMKALNDPYNTYKYKGLPPGPIGNPGLDALKAAMNPDGGNWYYFISLDGKVTEFTETHAEFDKLYQQYNAQ